MIINNPVFVIPNSNLIQDKKGGGGEPTLFVKANDFDNFKRKRTTELSKLIFSSEQHVSDYSVNKDTVFFKIKLNKKATSKSAQPTAFTKKFNIDFQGQQNETTFLATTNVKNLKSFQQNISQLSLQSNPRDGAFLSTIEEFIPLNREDIIDSDTFELSKFTGFIYLYNSIPEFEGNKICGIINKKYGTNLSFFTSNAGAKLLYGDLYHKLVEEITNPLPNNPILRVEKSLDFGISQIPSSNYKLSDIEVVEPDSDAKVVILDSGIANLKVLNGLVIDQLDCINDKDSEDLTHGTFVASRAIFGNDIEDQIQQGQLNAKVKVIDVKLSNHTLIKEKFLVDSITTAVKKYYKTAKVFNLSINNGDYDWPSRPKHSFITMELDSLAKKYNVLFVISSGNLKEITGEYPKYFLDKESIITPPADSLNTVVVGSVADTHSTRSIANINEPSPFTRSGLIGDFKPDLVHFGGNTDKYDQYGGIGVKGLSIKEDGIAEAVGTSFAAPLVSQIAAQLFAYLDTTRQWNEPPAELVKALLIHSASYSIQADDKWMGFELNRLLGFGIPDLTSAIDCVNSSATFIFTGLIGEPAVDSKTAKYTKHKLKFTVPKELEGKGKKIKIRGTLVYLPEVSNTALQDYCSVDIQLNLHYKNSKGNLIGGDLIKKSKFQYRKRWNPILSFEKHCQSYQGGDWELWMDMTTRGITDVNYQQNYALVITVQDISPDEDSRIDLYNIIAQNNLYNKLQSKVPVKV